MENLSKTPFSNVNDTTRTLFKKPPKVYGKFSFARFPKSFPAPAIDLNHDNRHLKVWRIKVTWRGFSGAKKWRKNANSEEIVVEFFVLNNRKWRTFPPAHNLLLSSLRRNDHFLNSVTIVDVLTANKNDVNFVQTQTLHFFVTIKLPFRLDWPPLLVLINFFIYLPHEIPRDLAQTRPQVFLVNSSIICQFCSTIDVINSIWRNSSKFGRQ